MSKFLTRSLTGQCSSRLYRAFRRLKKPRIGTRADAATRFIAYAPKFAFLPFPVNCVLLFQDGRAESVEMWSVLATRGGGCRVRGVRGDQQWRPLHARLHSNIAGATELTGEHAYLAFKFFRKNSQSLCERVPSVQIPQRKFSKLT